MKLIFNKRYEVETLPHDNGLGRFMTKFDGAKIRYSHSLEDAIKYAYHYEKARLSSFIIPFSLRFGVVWSA